MLNLWKIDIVSIVIVHMSWWRQFPRTVSSNIAGKLWDVSNHLEMWNSRPNDLINLACRENCYYSSQILDTLKQWKCLGECQLYSHECFHIGYAIHREVKHEAILCRLICAPGQTLFMCVCIYMYIHVYTCINVHVFFLMGRSPKKSRPRPQTSAWPWPGFGHGPDLANWPTPRGKGGEKPWKIYGKPMEKPIFHGKIKGFRLSHWKTIGKPMENHRKMVISWENRWFHWIGFKATFDRKAENWWFPVKIFPTQPIHWILKHVQKPWWTDHSWMNFDDWPIVQMVMFHSYSIIPVTVRSL